MQAWTETLHKTTQSKRQYDPTQSHDNFLKKILEIVMNLYNVILFLHIVQICTKCVKCLS